MKKLYQSMRGGHLTRVLSVCAVTLSLLLWNGGLGAYAQASQSAPKSISITMKDATLENVLLQLRKLSNYDIVYNSDAVKSIKGISIEAVNKPINLILDECLKDTNLDYEIRGNAIVIRVKVASASTVKVSQSDQFMIKGVVTSKTTKTPLIGATAYVKGTTNGCVADAKGEYFLILDKVANQTIVFSYIGMETKEITYTGQTAIDVALSEKMESVGDVVVTGYANVRKEGFTGNTTRISREEMIKVSPKSIIQAIQVFDPSFRIAENIAMGSNPNSLPEFYIRGRNSINLELSADADISRQNLKSNPNLPIFILDGFEVGVEKVFDMDPTRIHSTTLLKDAAATALYGSRAANGVVVLESRAPEAGKLRISYNLTGSVEMPDLSSYNLMTARECLEAELVGGFYTTTTDLDNPGSVLASMRKYQQRLNEVNRGVDTYWLSQGLRNAVQHKHSLYIDGGENDVRWGIEMRYNNQPGVMKDSKRSTYGADLFLDYRIGKFQLMNRATFDAMDGSESVFNFSRYSHLTPYNPIRDFSTGKLLPSLLYDVVGSDVNPLYENAFLNSYNNSKYQDFSNKFAINFFGTQSFTAKAWITMSKRFGESRNFIDPLSTLNSNTAFDRRGQLTANNDDSFSYDGSLLLQYNKNFGKHYLNTSLGANIREDNKNSLIAKYLGFSSGSASSPNDALIMDGKNRQSSNKTRLFGGLFTANYSYDDIYLADISGRLDASSEFGSSKRTAPFFSMGAGINIHKYKFMEGSAINRLKIRATYGILGKVGFPPYAAQTSYQLSNTDYWYPTGVGQLLSYMGNEALGWEKTKVTDVGFDLGLFDDKLVITASYYNKITVDQITTVSLPSSSGFSSYMDNLGKIRNRGYELNLRYNFYKDKNWNLSVFGNVSHNKNQIMEISDALRNYNKLVQKQYDNYESGSNSEYSKYARVFTQYVEGGSLTSIFGMKSLGINPANGREVYMTSDGTISYDWDASQQTVLGNTEPKAQGAMGLNASWKNFTLFTSFMFEFGGQRYNSTLVSEVENVAIGQRNLDKRVSTDRWVKPGDVAPLKDITDRKRVTRPSSRFIQDYNMLKFNSLSLSYDFDSALIKKAGLSMLRLTATMQDLGLWSNVLQERGLSYPYSRVVNFSLNLTF